MKNVETRYPAIVGIFSKNGVLNMVEITTHLFKTSEQAKEYFSAPTYDNVKVLRLLIESPVTFEY